jgi:hypothetical protein
MIQDGFGIAGKPCAPVLDCGLHARQQCCVACASLRGRLVVGDDDLIVPRERRPRSQQAQRVPRDSRENPRPRLKGEEVKLSAFSVAVPVMLGTKWGRASSCDVGMRILIVGAMACVLLRWQGLLTATPIEEANNILTDKWNTYFTREVRSGMRFLGSRLQNDGSWMAAAACVRTRRARKAAWGVSSQGLGFVKLGSWRCCCCWEGSLSGGLGRLSPLARVPMAALGRGAAPA